MGRSGDGPSGCGGHSRCEGPGAAVSVGALSPAVEEEDGWGRGRVLRTPQRRSDH